MMAKVAFCPNGHEWRAEECAADTGSRCPVCGAWSDLTPPPPSPTRSEAAGSTVAMEGERASGCLPQRIGRFGIEAELGRGGMGVVYRAHDPQLNRIVALKVLRGGAGLDGLELARFRREAESAARLRHPGVVPVFEMGEWEGRPYFAMECVEGGDLRRHPAWVGREARGLAAVFESLARGVHAAHEAGIVHRDLKPANVLLGEGGMARVSDFGLARRLDAAGELTVAGTVMGTPAYMAPEQVGGGLEEVGPAADVFALGVMLYEGLTGRRPFEPAGGDVLSRRRAIEEGDVAPPSRLRAGIARDLDTICLKCLRPWAADRYPTAGELAEDLRRFLNDEPVTARRIGAVTRTLKWARRRPWWAVGVLSGFLLVLAAGGGWWYADGYVWPHKSWHVAVGFAWGSPVGVGRVAPDDRAGRDLLYEITRRGRRGPVTRLRAVRGDGSGHENNPMRTWFDGLVGVETGLSWSSVEYARGERGEVLQETAYDLGGRVAYRMTYGYSAESRAVARYFAETGLDLTTPRGTLVIELERDGLGRDRVVTFRNARGEPATNREGVYGYRLEYGGAGPLPMKIENLGLGGGLMTNAAGVAAVRLEYDEAGRERSVIFLGASGGVAESKDGVAVTEVERNDRGDPGTVRFFDAARRAAVHRGLGVAGYGLKYDSGKRWVEQFYFGTDGRAAEGTGGARVRTVHDGVGRQVAQLSWGLDGRLLGHSQRVFDGAGRLVEERSWGDEEARTLLGRMQYVYEGDRATAQLLYTGGGKLLRATRRRFDGRGRLVEERHEDGAGAPLRWVEGHSKTVLTYHDDGSISTRTRYGFDPAGGFDAVEERFDELGQPLGSRRFAAK